MSSNFKKMLGLDLGDKWTGIAISDALGITARPLTTVATYDLAAQLAIIIQEEGIATIVVGDPKTLKGTESDQTKKVHAMVDELKNQFPAINWVWWDERNTSEQAAHLMRPKNKEDKLASHAVAAALLLMGYLNSLQF
jgi:putative Holliday junction resolvase